jgi:hypothetical protein
MKVKISKSFQHGSSPRPFLENELVDVPEELAQKWIDQGRATAFAPSSRPVVNAVPPRRQRERAIRIS